MAERFLIMANGEYGDPEWYRGRAALFDRIICVDGAAGHAIRLGVTPDLVVGDMDSLRAEDREAIKGVPFSVFPPEKDETDTQIAFKLAVREGARDLTVWGGTGTRLDHTLSNLYSASWIALQGTPVRFESPILNIYLVKDVLKFSGRVGDTVSVFSIGGKAVGVTLEGFKYPLNDVEVDSMWQYGVSNIITGKSPVVRVASGLLAVFHYRELP